MFRWIRSIAYAVVRPRQNEKLTFPGPASVQRTPASRCAKEGWVCKGDVQHVALHIMHSARVRLREWVVVTGAKEDFFGNRSYSESTNQVADVAISKCLTGDCMIQVTRRNPYSKHCLNNRIS